MGLTLAKNAYHPVNLGQGLPEGGKSLPVGPLQTASITEESRESAGVLAPAALHKKESARANRTPIRPSRAGPG